MEYTITKLRRFSSHRFENQAIALGSLPVYDCFELFACEDNKYLWQYFILEKDWDRNSVSGVPVFALIELSVRCGKLRAYVDTSKHSNIGNISEILKQTTQKISSERKRGILYPYNRK